MLPRVLEPEVMDTAEEARDYDAMDHAAVNRAFVADFLAVWNGGNPILDVGTGTAQIPIELCRQSASAEVLAIDLAENMLARVLEPEVMDTPQEALDYDTMDHSAVNRVFVDDLLAVRPTPGDVLDLGTGTALIPVELCQREPTCRVMAVDAAVSMLELARYNVGSTDRIQLAKVDAKQLGYEDGMFDTVMSNSIIHHIPEPLAVLAEAVRVTKPGGMLFFRDLLRPEDMATLQQLVDIYAARANEHQRKMFGESLHAALTLEEIRDLVASLGFEREGVRATSDRHWTWVAAKPT